MEVMDNECGDGAVRVLWSGDGAVSSSLMVSCCILQMMNADGDLLYICFLRGHRAGLL